MGEDPELEGLVERGKTAADVCAGREAVKGLVEQWEVDGRGERFDADENIEQGFADRVRGAEQFGPGGAEFLETGIGGEEGKALRRKRILMLFEQASEDVAMETGYKAGIGEEFQGHRSI